MDFETEQQIISYGVAGAGCVFIGFFSNPDGVLSACLVIFGIVLVGFGGILQGSIRR
jgi:hypothetical protein